MAENRRFDEIPVDGEPIIVPSLADWEILLKDPRYDGAPVYSLNTERLVRGFVEVVKRNERQFCLGLYRRIKSAWFALPLFACADGWQRVQLEDVRCDSCRRIAKIANPTEPSLYFGVPNEPAATQRAFRQPRVGCPHCGRALPRIAVWAGAV